MLVNSIAAPHLCIFIFFIVLFLHLGTCTVLQIQNINTNNDLIILHTYMNLITILSFIPFLFKEIL